MVLLAIEVFSEEQCAQSLVGIVSIILVSINCLKYLLLAILCICYFSIIIRYFRVPETQPNPVRLT